MSAVVHFPGHQGSADWHEHRRRMGNASEAAAVMDCGVWFPRTPYELWLLKSGQREEGAVTPAMDRGLLLEPRARAWLEAVSDEIYEPQVVSRGRLSASLDGLSFDGREILEIKCPVRGQDSETWQAVAAGRPPEHYWWQVQQQLYCADAERCRFAVFHAEDDVVVDMVECIVLPDEAAQLALNLAWERLFECLDTDAPPPYSERDVVERDDVEWRDAVSDWKESRRWLEEARRAEAEARKRLLAMAGERSTVGAGVRVTRYWRSGQVDWRRATEGLDLEPYRKPGGWQYRIGEQDD